MSSKMLSPFMKKKQRPGYEKGDPSKLFDLLECLGEGTYGTVWTGTEKKTGRTCAVKIVTIDDDLEEIEQEIAIMRDSDSPYVVKFYGAYWADKKKIWMVMEHCIAGSLNDLMYVCDITLDVDQIKTAASAMSMGLKYLHKNLVIHRDIKAGNVLLTAEGHIRLADFGVSAKLKKPTDRTNTAIGAPFWMAPEVINEEDYDGRADVWSLGITLIELAEGRPPNSHINPMKALFIIPQQAPPTLNTPEKWPVDFVDFIKMCLVKNPTKRPYSKNLPGHSFIKDECLSIERNEGRSAIMSKLIKKSLRKIENWRNKDDESDKTDKVSDVASKLSFNEKTNAPPTTKQNITPVPKPTPVPASLPRQRSNVSEDMVSEKSEEVISMEDLKRMQEENNKKLGRNTASSPVSPHPSDKFVKSVGTHMSTTSLHINPLKDKKLRDSVRQSVRRVEPLRDVAEPQDGKSVAGFMRKEDQNNLSETDVANIMNSDLPAHSNQVQAAVMTKEFIVLLKSIYKADPKAFGGKALKNWTGEDITVAVVKALQMALDNKSPDSSPAVAQNFHNEMGVSKTNNIKSNGKADGDDEFDEGQFQVAEDFKTFMHPVEFNPALDGDMPPPPPLDDEDDDLDL